MILTIDIKDSVADKILYFLQNFKDDIKIIDSETLNSDIEIIDKNDPDYKVILKGREERAKHPENYISEDEVDWNN
jgi:hypothetical protein